MSKIDQYFKVLSESDGDTATVLLYDYIGREYDDSNAEKDTTDIAFVRKMRELEKNHSRINVRINSSGGSVKHGLAIMTAIRTSSAEVHTYADGVVASMAADIFTAAPHRHMAKNALLMIHGASGFCFGNAEAMRREADTLEKMNEAASTSLVEITSMSQEEVNERFYDGNDHWLTYKDAAEMSIVNEAEEYETETEGDAESMKRSTYAFLKAQKQKFQAHYKTLTNKTVQDAPKEDELEIVNQEETEEMTIDSVLAALKSGGLEKAALQAGMDAMGKTEGEKYDELLAAVKANNEQIKALGSQNASLAEENEALKAKLDSTPAADATKVATDADPVPPLAETETSKAEMDFHRKQAAKFGLI